MYTSFGSTWHPDGKKVIFLSDMGDRYGLYTIDTSDLNHLPQLLTDPSYDVLSTPSIAGDAVFYSGNGVNPYEQHVYRLKISNGDPRTGDASLRPKRWLSITRWPTLGVHAQ
jgi:dipeptidyl-peptidase-4